MTARAYDATPEELAAIKEWLERIGLGNLAITCTKDPAMEALWDDKAVQVRPNTGEPIVDEEFQSRLAESLDMSRGSKLEAIYNPLSQLDDIYIPANDGVRLGSTWQDLEKDADED